MKSNRPLWSNMSWRTHKCLRTCWGNMHFRRRSRLTNWSSHWAKYRANVLLKRTCVTCAQNTEETLESKWVFVLTFLLFSHTCWQSDVNHPPSTPSVIQSVCPHVVLDFLWWTTGGRNNLPLQPFPPQLPGNIITKAVWGALVPAVILKRPSGCHLLPRCKAASTSDLFFFRADSCITPALVMQTDEPERCAETTRVEQACTV